MSNVTSLATVEIVGAIAAATVSIGIPYIAYKLRELEVFKVTLMGVEGVESMDGIVGSVEMLDTEVEGHGNKIKNVERDLQTMRLDMQEIEEKVEGNEEALNRALSRIETHGNKIETTEEKMKSIQQRVDRLSRRIKERNGFEEEEDY